MNKCSKFYSQGGEDFLLWSLFKEKGISDGFYIDIGAFDGIHFSNSFFFEKQGWKGVCVEAHPKYFALCEKNRPRSVCIEKACVGEGSSGSVIFNSEELGLFSGVAKEPIEAISRRYARRNLEFSGYTEIQVETITLNEIIRQFAGDRKAIDFVSIDTEGTELQILENFDFSHYVVRIFIVEANDEEHARQLIELMRKNGYELSRVITQNYIFTGDRDTHLHLRYKRISCQIADGVHPLGERVTKPNERGYRIEERRCWITPNVLCQEPHQPLWSLLDYFPTETADYQKPPRIIHMVNPYPVSVNPTSGKYQEITYDSMRAARDFAGDEIVLVSIQHEHDEELTPDGFERGRDLDRVVTEFASFREAHPLPLLFDILERGAELANLEDVLIYTNSDIILMPFFYSAIREFTRYGFDAMNICRRSIGQHAAYIDQPNLARSEVGDIHPGSDCFVFTKKVYEQFISNNCCVGRGGVAKSLLFNMAASAERMLVLRNVNLTYHIGDDRKWMAPEVQDYTAYNFKELDKLYVKLCQSQKKKELLNMFVSTYWQ